MLKFVVIIVVALAEGEQRHDKRIARAAARGIGLAADSVAGGVNEKRAVLEDHGFRDAAQKQTAERAVPPIPNRADDRGQNHPHCQSE